MFVLPFGGEQAFNEHSRRKRLRRKQKKAAAAAAQAAKAAPNTSSAMALAADGSPAPMDLQLTNAPAAPVPVGSDSLFNLGSGIGNIASFDIAPLAALPVNSPAGAQSMLISELATAPNAQPPLPLHCPVHPFQPIFGLPERVCTSPPNSVSYLFGPNSIDELLSADDLVSDGSGSFGELLLESGTAPPPMKRARLC